MYMYRQVTMYSILPHPNIPVVFRSAHHTSRTTMLASQRVGRPVSTPAALSDIPIAAALMPSLTPPQLPSSKPRGSRQIALKVVDIGLGECSSGEISIPHREDLTQTVLINGK
ncbi:hypothetical protein MRB53_019581 [Persea americana]|uniref:Uncharacterized protein n=1 Tax=Persea americana TaxID=3435 RepID=A0ACC2KYG9_PERAE|nr:hypothetical protein MRB53_019581 [Persea americana]